MSGLSSHLLNFSPTRSAVLLRGILAGIILVMVGAAAWPPAAQSRFLKGFDEPLYKSGDATIRNHWYDESRRAAADIARVDVAWRQITTGRPEQPTDPADPAYDFSSIDRAVGAAGVRGMRALLTVYSAPDFAEAKNRPDNPDELHPRGTFRPDPKEYGKFAQAVARRYSGDFAPSPLEPPLPKVGYFEAWNEPNISLFLNPQWNGKKNQAVPNYRRLLNKFYKGVKRGSPSAKVISAGLAPFGDDPPNDIRTRPLRFMREFLCLKPKRKLTPDKCKNPPKFDMLAHHPINIYGGPRKSGSNPDDINAADDMRRVKKTLRFAERKRTIRGGRHGIWATELWWETEPPDPVNGYPLGKQARWMEEAMYLVWKHSGSAAIFLQTVDSPLKEDGGGLQSGIFFNDGSEKPSFRAFRFPFVTERRSKKKILAWTVPPASGKLSIQQKKNGGWKTRKRVKAKVGRPVKTKLKLRGRSRLRAEIDGERSLSWKQRSKKRKRATSRRLSPRTGAIAPNDLPPSDPLRLYGTASD